MASELRFLTSLGITALLMASAVPIWNLAIDPTRSLRGDVEYRHKGREGNIRHLKIAHVIAETPRLDSFVFGSSRIRYGMPVDYLGDNWIKLDFPGGHPRELLPILDAFETYGVPAREIWLGIDDFALYDPPGDEPDAWLKPHPASIWGWLDHYRFYLFRRPTSADRLILARLWNDEPLLEETDRITGEKGAIEIPPRTPEQEKQIFFRRSPARADLAGKEPRVRYLLDIIGEIVERCREANIKLVVFTTPRHAKTILFRNHDELDHLKRELAETVPFYDFSWLSFLSSADSYWHEPSHFGPRAGRVVMDTIQNDRTGIGVLVGPENVDAHIAKSRASLVRSIPLLVATNPSVEIHPSLLNPVPVAAYPHDLGGAVIAAHQLEVVPNTPGEAFEVVVSGSPARLAFAATTASEAVDAHDPLLLEVLLEAESPEGSARIVDTAPRPKQARRYVDSLQEGRSLYAPRSGASLAEPVVIEFGAAGRYRINDIRFRRLREPRSR